MGRKLGSRVVYDPSPRLAAHVVNVQIEICRLKNIFVNCRELLLPLNLFIYFVQALPILILTDLIATMFS